MNTSILIGLCAVLFVAAPTVFAEQQTISSVEGAESDIPESVACAQERGEPLGLCSYRIKHDANGKTTVTVIFPNGFKRGLFFMDGAFLKASVTMSGVGTNGEWSVVDDMHIIRVDGQHFEVPVALIAGN